MRWNPIAILLITFLMSPAAQADSPFAGITYGEVSVEEGDMENLGVVAGYLDDSGFGFEAFYLQTISEDSASRGDISADASVDTWGVLGFYQTSGDFYVKGKLGVAVVNLEFDIEGRGHIKDSTADFAYGVAVGATLGNGAFELAYTVLPEFEEFNDVKYRADVEMIDLSYRWYF